MKKIIAIAIFSTFALGQAAQADTIKFTGKVVDTPCLINPDDINKSVELGQVKQSEMATKGAKGSATQFSLTLEECDLSKLVDKTAAIKFTGMAATGDATLLGVDSGAGSAAGVGIEIADGLTGTAIPLNTEATTPVELTEGSNSLKYSARFVSTGETVKTGRANATADFAFTYK